LRRWVELPAAARGQEHFLVLGDTRSSFVQAWVNGHFVGLDGEVRRLLKNETTTLQGYAIPAQYMTGERALVALKVSTPPNPGWEGIYDHRFLLGTAEPVHAWFLRAAMLDNLLITSPILLSVFLMLLLGVLFVIEGKRADQHRYLLVIAFIGACVLWQTTRNGVFPLDVIMRRHVHFYATLGMVLAGMEQVEYLFMGRIGRWIVINRVMMACCAILPLLSNSPLVAVGIMAYLCVPLTRTLFLAGRSLLRGPKGLNGLVDVGVLLLAVTGVNDLLSFLSVITTPMLFGLGLNYLALISATVVIGDFVSISQTNQLLSISLQKSNVQLEHTNLEVEKKNVDLAKALELSQIAVRVKSEFLAKVSHELRTPLNAIINIPEGLLEDFPERQRAVCAACGFSFEFDGDAAYQDLQACQQCQSPKPGVELLSVQYSGEPSHTRSYLDTVRRSGKHLLSVVDDVLDFSKLEAGKLKLQLESVQLQTIISDLGRTLAPVASGQRIQLVFPEVGQAQLTADPVKLMQIFINLIGNAIKFSPQGGTVEMTHACEGDEHVFTVRDHGIGIAPEHQQFIFEGFRQVEGASTRRYGGTGLGLAITRELVTLHGGALSLVSQVGEGTTFTVRLPQDAKLAPQKALVVAEPVATRKRVLVVDDEVIIVETLRLAIDESRIELIGISDPREALGAIRKHQPDLVILDVMMPRVSGLSILGELRADPALKALPVLVLSAYSSNREVALSLGARWLRKPWQREELDAVIQEVLAEPKASLAKVG
jgi:signal transduction histidine kinase/ActR/RegA family two-component response regulator